MTEDLNAPFMTHLDGNNKINIEGVISAIMDGRIWKYPDTSFGRMTLMNKSNYHHSFLYHTLEKIIKYGTTEDGIWWDMKWNNPNWGEVGVINQVVDSLFYDEFVFLISEGLLKYKVAETITLNQIFYGK